MSATKSGFGAYTLYTIKNAAGASVSVTDLGAAVQSIIVPDRNGVLGDVVLGYDTPQEYLCNDGYFGAAVGRYANRIAGAQFMLGGTQYKITANEGANTLHGGVGFSKRRFDVAAVTDNSVCFELHDPDGGDGFPGNITVSVEYEFTDDDNKLIISYTARSDKDTVLNLTNHSYFNLAGRGDILSHELVINADSYLPVDGELIPTGEVRPVDDTDFDFRTRRKVKNGYYDHCFILNSEKCAELYEPECGRIMRVTTDMPAVQFYAGGATGTRNGKNGAVYGKNSALCLETQFYPDAPNRPGFPSAVLKANDTYSHRTVYEFTTDRMTTIKIDEYAFSVDIEKTREYYETHSLCDCGNCRNFYAQAREKLPKLADFLAQFGVDISRPDEAWGVEADDHIDYISTEYTVCGRVEEIGKYEIDLHDEQFLSVIVTDGFTSPNEQTGEYFTLSVDNISLPWALAEPFPEPIKTNLPSKLKRFLGKIFG